MLGFIIHFLITIRLLVSQLVYYIDLKVTYHENQTFSMFKCYNRVPGVSTNPENMKKNNPVLFFGKPFSASL